MFGVIWIRVGFEDFSVENHCWGICVHVVSLFFALGVLCANVSNERIESGVNVFDVVFAHDLFVDDRGVFLLLGETHLEQEKL